MAYQRKRPPKPPEYSGRLGEPLRPYVSTSRSCDPDDDPREKEIVEKLDLLCDHFGIRRDHKDRWQLLARALAEKHVRGFHEAEPDRRGRRKHLGKGHWPWFDEWALWQQLQELVESGLSERRAADELAKQPKYRQHKETGPALLRRAKRFEKGGLHWPRRAVIEAELAGEYDRMQREGTPDSELVARLKDRPWFPKLKNPVGRARRAWKAKAHLKEPPPIPDDAFKSDWPVE